MAEALRGSALLRHVRKRAGNRCEYCQTPSSHSADTFAIEHIVPKSRRGSNEPDNLALSCQGCNGYKYTSVNAIDPVNGALAGLYNPRKDRWSDHFMWNQDYTQILGISPTGRATIVKLRLNREGLVNLREALLAIGIPSKELPAIGEPRNEQRPKYTRTPQIHNSTPPLQGGL